MEHQIAECLFHARFSNVIELIAPVTFYDCKLVELWEVLDRLRLQPVGHGQEQESLRSKHLIYVFKSYLYRRNYVLKYFSRYDKVVRLAPFGRDSIGGDIETRFLMEIGVLIIELLL